LSCAGSSTLIYLHTLNAQMVNYVGTLERYSIGQSIRKTELMVTAGLSPPRLCAWAAGDGERSPAARHMCGSNRTERLKAPDDASFFFVFVTTVYLDHFRAWRLADLLIPLEHRRRRRAGEEHSRTAIFLDYIAASISDDSHTPHFPSSPASSSPPRDLPSHFHPSERSLVY